MKTLIGLIFVTVLTISGMVSASQTAGSAVTIVQGGNVATVSPSGALKVETSGSAGPQEVTGTFWPETQPVSGTFWQATQPVSGTFWQAVQPVSGTFWPATQPVSGTVSVTTSAPLDVTCVSGCGTPSQAQTYYATTPAVATAASQDALNLYNASGSGKVIKILAIRVSQDGSAAVTGLQAAFVASRFTTVGATCTAGAITPADTTNAAVPAQVTVNKQCTTDPAGTLTTLGYYSFYADETNPGTRVLYEFLNNGGQPMTLREGQGLMLKLGATAPVGVYSVTVEFSM